ncbi:hypothetical protein [Capnocytophaga canimorsus]|uniref:Uncharacterized protein n=1 Tax=Capnocytophaga canimorsus (strain 5) TaxID=860228 RepID=F9YU54_CAPCC|nr:hypothetical protein [Capnocytophaga canimorsus]AEK24172.1 Conserved hypothetical protein [Capnocytophaga canimorsus Cc5]VEJ19203.1 Uncharacterised protein [Capnocytophaga canimorsus]
MEEKFNIQICVKKEYLNEFPMISSKILQYVWNYIEEKFLKPKNIWINDKYCYSIGIFIYPLKEGGYYQDNIFNTDETKYLTPKFSTSKLRRHNTLFIDSALIHKNTLPSTFASLIYDVFASLILVYTKKLSKEDFDREKENLDFDLINSFPFPAILEEAQYQIFPDLS